MDVKIVPCDDNGNIDLKSLHDLAVEHKDRLSAFMVTYPSTHGIFETEIKEMIDTVHEHGGLVYMDGANLNAQLGLTQPALIGADVCHLNLHKTFAIPHGGGGPGMGPLGVAEHLVEFLPTHPVVETGGKNGIEPVAGSPWGSPSILPISHAFCRMLGAEGLKKVSKISILNANYIAASLEGSFKILYKGEKGMVGHEMILECRNFKNDTGITETDIAKRLIDYGFHAPTLSFPVPGTLMVEPTESESLQELDRFIEAMRSIYEEIQEVKEGKADEEDNVLKNAPHTSKMLTAENWPHSYSKEKAVYPLSWIPENKFWPPVRRVNDAYGDRHLVARSDVINQVRQKNKSKKN
jgi:glycine dehydrogenase